MCGIAGFSINPKDDHINARLLAQSLLLGIEHRGKDATGAAWLDRRGNWVTQKRDRTATDFVPDLALDKRATVAILHTRMWTQGKPENPLNNHPIHANDIIGVHNGMVSNDDELIRDAVKAIGYERLGEVDSEGIFAAIAATGKTGDLMKTLEEIEAKMAIAWVDQAADEKGILHLARGDSSPLIVAQTENGSLVFASEVGTLQDAAKACGITFPYMEQVKEGTYFKVRDGMIAESKTFFPMPAWGSYYAATSTAPVSTNSVTKNHSTSFLDMRYLDPDTHIETPAVSSFERSNKSRIDNIAKWMQDHAYIEDSDVDGHAIFTQAAIRGAFLRPGDWVQTWAVGEWCDAQVYRLPRTFPDGDFILRVFIPVNVINGVEPEWDVVFLARSVLDIEGPQLHSTPSESDLAPYRPKLSVVA